ncbi:MAG TPA: hypothetical protein VJR23_03575 [Candidatus Acidoferrales bacterium]|nr:hypothetical protein [Candidatus Acidoferrales bacterium]
MNFQLGVSESYRVEVSGWDASENFFVEKTILDWTSEESKEVLLHSALREGSVVFMRLLQPMSGSNNFPLAYQAVNVKPKDSTGKARVSLAQLRPKASRKDLDLVSQNNVVRVA